MSKPVCKICKKDLPLFKAKNQIYCDKSESDCWKKGERINREQRNEERKKNVQLKCKRCKQDKDNNGKKYCTKCIKILSEKKCKTCDNLVPSMKMFCDDCQRKKYKTERKCIYCDKLIPEGKLKQARFCSDRCKKARALEKKREKEYRKELGIIDPQEIKIEIKKEKNKKWDIDPKFLVRGLK